MTLKRYIEQQTGIDGIKDTDRIDESGLDSLDLICLVRDIDEETSFLIPLGKLDTLETFGDLIAFLEANNVVVQG